MGDILKRFIGTASVTGRAYSGATLKSKAIKTYLEQEGLQSWMDAHPKLNEAGAEAIEVVAMGHEGGSVSTEPFHLNVHVKDKRGKLMETKNPHTGRKTKTWHAYIGESNQDLANKKIGSQEKK